MYKIKSYCLQIISLFFLMGCSSFKNYEILSAPVVSMSHSHLPKKYRLKVGKHFVSRFCKDEKPLLNTGVLVGMADQAIYKAQKKFKATHLVDTRISHEGDCVIVEGNWAQARKIRKKRRKRRKNASETSAEDLDYEFTDKILPPDQEKLKL